MGKRMNKRVERGMLSAEGATITEAKQALEARIDAALEGTYHPHLISYGDCLAVVYREPHGWCYRGLGTALKDGISVLYGTNYDDREQAIQAAAFHVLDEVSEDSFHQDSDIPAFLTDAGRRADLLSNARFRRAYRWVRAERPEDNDHLWHQWACYHSRDERFA